MTNVLEKQKPKGEKTLLTALLLSAPGPIFTGLSVITSFSSTQIADFLRRGTELVAIFISWFIYRKTQRSGVLEAEKTRLERLANLSVGAAMSVTGVIMLIIAASRIVSYTPSGNVTLGLVIAILGFITNTWFWLRYRALNRETFNAVIGVQQRLYRAKSLVDMCVVTALTTVALASTSISRYVDILGSVIVSCYLLWMGIKTIREKQP